MSSSLSSHERSVIETMIKLNHSIREIARFLKRSPATIAYELNRIHPYNAQQAHHLAQCSRHKHGRHPTLTPEISAFLNHHIGILKWSPETA
ncbi:helix-turn-helix domain-containing protein, partial [Leuconostoc falkenbergense]|uniref:helix-turn-helix domain-containing protein n=1 Tax=Leuconostoc falkenbergense TaxID=2766470 RepID=UPI0021AA44F3